MCPAGTTVGVGRVGRQHLRPGQPEPANRTAARIADDLSVVFKASENRTAGGLSNLDRRSRGST